MTNVDTGTNHERGEVRLDRRAIDSITTYEITEDQLVVIENTTSSNELNFSIALLSSFATLTITLLITEINGLGRLVFIWTLTIICAILGLYFALGYKKKKQTSVRVFEKIRGQKSIEAIRDNSISSDSISSIGTESGTGKG